MTIDPENVEDEIVHDDTPIEVYKPAQDSLTAPLTWKYPMIITRITLNPRRALNAQRLTQMGRDVRASVGAVPQAPPVLWLRTGRSELVVVSDLAPDWTQIAGAVSASSRKLPAHADGARVEWELTANPVRSQARRGPDGKAVGRGRKVEIKDRDQARDWFLNRLDGPLAEVEITDCSWLPRPEGAPNRWRAAGTATVADSHDLNDLQAAGVGRSKAQGCGLLLVEEISGNR